MAQTTEQTPHTRTASYLAERGEVGRVLLLYSGGLDTSVMLAWLARVRGRGRHLTVDLASPARTRSRSRKARQRRAQTIDARECSRACTSGPRSRPGRCTGAATRSSPRSAARSSPSSRSRRPPGGCDVAHGCTGKGNDQVRFDAPIATLAPELKVIAPIRGWQMGRDEEIEYARKHGIPVKGGNQVRRTRSMRTSGAGPRGALIEDPSHAPPATSSSRHPARGGAREPERVEIAFERGMPVASTVTGSRASSCSSGAEIGARTGSAASIRSRTASSA